MWATALPWVFACKLISSTGPAVAEACAVATQPCSWTPSRVDG